MNCPICGSTMIKRVAGKGTNIGKEFYGCSKFPNCRGTINVPETKMKDIPEVYSKKLNEVSINNTNNINKINNNMMKDNPYNNKMPELKDKNNLIGLIPLYSEPSKKGNELYYFQSIAVPNIAFNALANGYIQDKDLTRHSRFSLELPIAKYEVSYEQKAICSLVLRLLNRGIYTKNSHNIEEFLKNSYQFTESEIKKLEILDSFIQYDSIMMAHDSEREFDLMKRLELAFGPNFYSHIISQVYLNSLVGEETISSIGERVDFLLSIGDVDYVIEVDGSEHELHASKDKNRDERLIDSGYKVVRIKNDEFDNGNSKELDELLNICENYKIRYKKIYNDSEKYLIASKIIHQLQISLVKAVEIGVIAGCETVQVNINTDVFTVEELNKISSIALEDLTSLFEHFCDLYRVNYFFGCELASINEQNCFIISYGNSISSNGMVVRDIHVMKDLVAPIEGISSIYPSLIKRSTLEYFLRYVYHYDKFQEGQYEAIERILLKKDTIVLLPTGSGKSLIYQLSSLIVPGQTMVVTPLTSLMIDQVNNLKEKGITNAVAIYSSSSQNGVRKSSNYLKYKHISLVYISPERLQMMEFRTQVQASLVENSVYTVAVDEAHCVSEWGHDFRTSYLNIGRNTRKVFMKNGDIPIIVALTGTASTAVLKDVKRELSILDYEAIITPKTFDRKELHYSIIRANSDNKSNVTVTALLEQIPRYFQRSRHQFYGHYDNLTNCGVVFCPHVNGSYGITNLKNNLIEKGVPNVGLYAGSAPKDYMNKNWEVEKESQTIKFKQNKTNVLVSTKAFGMGIDKPNIRFTVHYGIPGSIESFYQEVGRAGRDRMNAYCTIIYSDDNEILNRRMLDVNTPLEEVIKYMDKLTSGEQDDISRMLYFHVNSFKGIDKEVTNVRRVLELMFETEEQLEKSSYTISAKDKAEAEQLEKAIQRLIVLGIVKDLTINYASNEYVMKVDNIRKDSIIDHYCRYVSGYNSGRVVTERKKILEIQGEHKHFILGAAKVLIEFIYDTIEKGRRRGLREITHMSNAALLSKEPDMEIRSRVIRYFESTYSEEINAIIEDKNLGFQHIISIIDGTVDELGEQIGGVRSYNEAARIRGQVSRDLESLPDHPGLLFLRALAELYSSNFDKNSIQEDYIAAIQFAKDRYSCDENRVLDFSLYFLNKTYESNYELYENLFNCSMKLYNAENICNRIIMNELYAEEMKVLPASVYMNHTIERVLNKIKK